MLKKKGFINLDSGNLLKIGIFIIRKHLIKNKTFVSFEINGVKPLGFKECVDFYYYCNYLVSVIPAFRIIPSS